MKRELREIVKKFQYKKILVIGDVMLDHYAWGNNDRENPEKSGQKIFFDEKDDYRVGGAGNVALSIATLGAETYLMGFVGRDGEGEIIRDLLRGKVQPYFGKCEKTTVKKRCICKRTNELVLRNDREDLSEKKWTDDMKQKLDEKLRTVDLVLISDYAKGTITNSLMRLLASYDPKPLIVVDPKPTNEYLDKSLYRGVRLIKPNKKESFELTGCSDVFEAGRILRQTYNTDILITRGSEGMTLFAIENEEEISVPSLAEKVSDVTVIGAGDAVVSVNALALAAGATLKQALDLANLAVSRALKEEGVYPVTNYDLESVLNEQDEN